MPFIETSELPAREPLPGWVGRRAIVVDHPARDIVAGIDIR